MWGVIVWCERGYVAWGEVALFFYLINAVKAWVCYAFGNVVYMSNGSNNIWFPKITLCQSAFLGTALLQNFGIHCIVGSSFNHITSHTLSICSRACTLYNLREGWLRQIGWLFGKVPNGGRGSFSIQRYMLQILGTLNRAFWAWNWYKNSKFRVHVMFFQQWYWEKSKQDILWRRL